MGSRYILTIICPKCGYEDEDVYYAPTCGIMDWRCPNCRIKVNLEKYTGITYEMASNREEIEKMAKKILKR